MTDKARAHNNGTTGEYLYGENSGLDAKVLGLLGISGDDFAKAAGEHDDEALQAWVLENSSVTQAEIDEFNHRELSLEPPNEQYKQMLRDRLAKYAPGRTDITTVLQSMELDDWGSFWQVDLTVGPPRSPHSKDVAGCHGVGRMADKARAARAGKIGEYKYGEDSGQDRRILEFLGISEDDFQEAAVNNPNDVEIGTWMLENSGKGADEIAAFNERMANWGPEDESSRAYFEQRRQEVAPTRTDIKTWADLQDVDDKLSFE
jgi:hypothetical protein